MRGHHKRGTARFGCLRRFCLSTHSESFGVIRWPECDCVCAGVGLSGGRGRLLTHVHRASACTLNAVGLLPVSGCGDARVAPPCPTTLCVWRNLPYLTLPWLQSRRPRGRGMMCAWSCSGSRKLVETRLRGLCIQCSSLPSAFLSHDHAIADWTICLQSPRALFLPFSPACRMAHAIVSFPVSLSWVLWS